MAKSRKQRRQVDTLAKRLQRANAEFGGGNYTPEHFTKRLKVAKKKFGGRVF